ncbi:MAG: hypothetical protein ABSE71_05335 [Candidatus Micrarchaeaceae archaeon]|jgi:hypothetical protein
MVAVTTKGEHSLRNALKKEFEVNHVQAPSYGSQKLEEMMLKEGGLFRKGRPERLTAMLARELSEGALEFDVCFRAQTLFVYLLPIEPFARKFLDTLDKTNPRGVCNLTSSRFLFNFSRSPLYREMMKFTGSLTDGSVHEYTKPELEMTLVEQLRVIAKRSFTDTTIFRELRH